MAAFLRGEKVVGDVVVPCLVNTNQIVVIFPARQVKAGVREAIRGWCLASLDDGSTVDLRIDFAELEEITDAAVKLQIAHAREVLRV